MVERGSPGLVVTRIPGSVSGGRFFEGFEKGRLDLAFHEVGFAR